MRLSESQIPALSIEGKQTKKYHLECQSSTDNSMLVRFIEYDLQIALDKGEIKGNVLTVTLLHSAVLFLRHQASTPDTMKIRVITPGGTLEYDIKVMKSQQCTPSERDTLYHIIDYALQLKNI